MKWIILALLFVSQFSFAQSRTEDSILWSWTRVEGEFDSSDEKILDRPLQYSMEFHYRLKNDMSDFNQIILRPMIGYKLEDGSTLWAGYTLVTQERAGAIVNEQRLFQMITYSSNLGKSPVVFVGNTRLEQRFLENEAEVGHRIRQSIRFSADLFKIKKSTLTLFFQDEIFIRLNTTIWAGKTGFDQNRITIGLDYKTTIKSVPTTISVGYMNFQSPTQNNHGINVGVRITIPSKKKNRR